MKKGAVLVFLVGDKYFFLSCICFSPVVINHIHYPSAMAAFQSFKFTDLDFRKRRFEYCDPFDAYQAGHYFPLRADWKQIREDVLYRVLWTKFKIPKFRERLVAVSEPIIVENNNGDVFWGVDAQTGEGKNRLGATLMRVRAEILKEM